MKSPHGPAAGRRRAPAATLLLFVVAGACSGCGGPSAPGADASPQFVRRHAWRDGDGVWLKIETHVHSEFSDGAWTIPDLVDEAARYGCDAVAITDHADADLGAATPAYFAALEAARRRHPELIVLAGLEWNIPPHGGDEHVTVLVEPTPAEAALLTEFKERFDDLGRTGSQPNLAEEALRWLAESSARAPSLAVVAYNHPSRKRYALDPFRDEFARLRRTGPLVIGFEGAPGHQAGQPLGAYELLFHLKDRWDPTAAMVGGVWDQLLGQGVDAWAALASADFHHNRPVGASDYLPGQFAETWVYAPDRTAHGLFAALQAGSFFASHGHIVRRAELTVMCPDLPRPAYAGECLRVPPHTACRVAVRLEIPDYDWAGDDNRIDRVDVIGVDAQGARVLKSFDAVADGQALTLDVETPPGGLVVRARGRRVVPDGPDLVFMTNPVRVLAPAAPSLPTSATVDDEDAAARGP